CLWGFWTVYQEMVDFKGSQSNSVKFERTPLFKVPLCLAGEQQPPSILRSRSKDDQMTLDVEDRPICRSMVDDWVIAEADGAEWLSRLSEDPPNVQGAETRLSLHDILRQHRSLFDKVEKLVAEPLLIPNAAAERMWALRGENRETYVMMLVARDPVQFLEDQS
ncbi:MAG: hypothetical protein Q9228_007746, partial [Teloschistes exilis]